MNNQIFLEQALETAEAYIVVNHEGKLLNYRGRYSRFLDKYSKSVKVFFSIPHVRRAVTTAAKIYPNDPRPKIVKLKLGIGEILEWAGK